MVDPERGEPRPETLLVEDGQLLDRLPPDVSPGGDWRRVPLQGRVVAPGFVDLHFHGGLFAAAAEDFAQVLRRSGETLLRSGTTAFLATTVAWSRASLGARVERLAELIGRGSPDGATCLGLHLEGPWISVRAAGAHAPEGIRPFEPAHDRDVLDRAGSLLRMVTLAPEVGGAARLLAELQARGAVAALGHSRATPAEIGLGIERGLAHATHLFNAMGPMHHREPGVPGTVLARDELSCDLICDGHHVHPAMVRVAARAVGDRLMLISDRVELAASDPSLPPASEDEPVHLPDGTLVGSRLRLDRAIRHLRDFAGLGWCEAVAACTSRPARLLGVEARHGTLRRGARADLAVMDVGGRVVETWLAGRRVFGSGAGPGGAEAVC